MIEIIEWIILSISIVCFLGQLFCCIVVGEDTLNRLSKMADICFIGATFSLLIWILMCYICDPKPKEKIYSSEKYQLEYRITTQNEKSDTTFVLIEK